MVERVFPAKLEQLEPVQAFLRACLAPYGCTDRVLFQLDMAAEEIFVNIAHYAYRPEQNGAAVVRCGVSGSPPLATVQFLDEGIPFDPLAKKDADVTLTAQERQIGGLGILMVKKTMDAMEYAYEDGKNVLTIRKSLREA